MSPMMMMMTIRMTTTGNDNDEYCPQKRSRQITAKMPATVRLTILTNRYQTFNTALRVTECRLWEGQQTSMEKGETTLRGMLREAFDSVTTETAETKDGTVHYTNSFKRTLKVSSSSTGGGNTVEVGGGNMRERGESQPECQY